MATPIQVQRRPASVRPGSAAAPSSAQAGAPPARAPRRPSWGSTYQVPSDAGDIGVPINTRSTYESDLGTREILWDGVDWAFPGPSGPALSNRANELGKRFHTVREGFYPATGGPSTPSGAPVATGAGSTGSWGYDRVASMRSAASEMGDLEGTELGSQLRGYLNEASGAPAAAAAAPAQGQPAAKAPLVRPSLQQVGDEAFVKAANAAFGRRQADGTALGFSGGQERTVVPLGARNGMNMDQVNAAFASLGMTLPKELQGEISGIQSMAFGGRGQGLPGTTRNLGLRDLDAIDQGQFRVRGGQLNTFR
jgi:hypothetical protein